jgi:leader peptidase (prepilin peptidase)/N-methyltransferase
MLAAALGACLGSFANVLIYRLPRNLSCVRPRSHCPACRREIPWYDNIPLCSWLLLRGRCRGCGAAISVRYWVVELLGALCGLIACWRFGPGVIGLAGMIFLIDLLAVALIDWEHMVIPHTLTVGGIVVGLGAAPFGGVGLATSALGCVSGAGVILILAYGYRLFRGRIGMGGGDVMLMGMVGAFLGVRGVLLVIFGGAFLGCLFIVLRYRAAVAGCMRLPFGTFLAAAAAVALLAGDRIVHWYWTLFLPV